MTETAFTVHLVDDDVSVLRALSRLLRVRGYAVQTFASAKEFIDRHNSMLPGCIILDVSMPGIDGLVLHQMLLASRVYRPVIFLTAKGDIPMSVRAVKAGAIDFLTKPVDDTILFDAIARAGMADANIRRQTMEVAALRAKIAILTPREHEVLTHVIAGRLNKQIASDLGTVEKTIKVHRGRMMDKLGVRTVADLVRLADKAGIAQADMVRVIRSAAVG